MRQVKIPTAVAVLQRHGYDVPEDVIREVLEATEDEPWSEYTNGDFVIVNEGMGECSFGTIIGRGRNDGYKVRMFEYEEKPDTYTRNVSRGDVGRIHTREEAMDYYWYRKGYKRIKLFLKKP